MQSRALGVAVAAAALFSAVLTVAGAAPKPHAVETSERFWPQFLYAIAEN